MHDALLLLGPTGSGKTPLGQWIERQGLWGRACRHFDFGEHLRRVVADAARTPAFSAAERDYLRGVVAGGALLDDAHFHLAARILENFLREPSAGESPPLVVLNGLPRHVGQAAAMQRHVTMRATVHLVCDEATVVARIAANVGGDRAGRTDDDAAAVRRRLAVYAAQIAPLAAYYRELGVPVVELPIGPQTTPQEAHQRLECLSPW